MAFPPSSITPSENLHPFKVAAFYKFVEFPDFEELRESLAEICSALELKGTILLAPEGINGTVAGEPSRIDRLVDELKSGPLFAGRLHDLEVKYSTAAEPPFLRLRVRLKKEIVTLQAPEASPARQVGTYVEPRDWNDLISRPDLLVIDTRNDYEVSIGTFKGAANPRTASFTEFKDYVARNLDPEEHRQVAMFCTGGIRCEKASSYLLAHGFEEVFHLKGGILKYLETVPEEESLWEGDCFVFDERVAVGPELRLSDYVLCHACRMPLSPEEVAHADYVKGVQCLYCKPTRSEEARDRARARQRQMELADARGYSHLGDDAMKSAEAARQRKRGAPESGS